MYFSLAENDIQTIGWAEASLFGGENGQTFDNRNNASFSLAYFGTIDWDRLGELKLAI